MASATTLGVNLTLQHAGFQAGMRQARQSMTAFKSTTEQVRGALRALGLSLGFIGTAGGIVGALGLAAVKTVRFIDDLGDMSKRLGIGTRDLAALQLTAQKAGIGVETLALNIQFMQRTISRGATDKGLQKFFESIGISLTAIRDDKPIQQFIKIAEQVRRIGNEADRIHAMQLLFGRSGGGLAGLIMGGTDSMKKDLETVSKHTAAFSESSVKAIEAVADAWEDLKFRMKAFLAEALVGIPKLADVTALSFNAVVKGMFPATTTNIDPEGKAMLNRTFGNLYPTSFPGPAKGVMGPPAPPELAGPPFPSTRRQWSHPWKPRPGWFGRMHGIENPPGSGGTLSPVFPGGPTAGGSSTGRPYDTNRMQIMTHSDFQKMARESVKQTQIQEDSREELRKLTREDAGGIFSDD